MDGCMTGRNSGRSAYENGMGVRQPDQGRLYHMTSRQSWGIGAHSFFFSSSFFPVFFSASNGSNKRSCALWFDGTLRKLARLTPIEIDALFKMGLGMRTFAWLHLYPWKGSLKTGPSC